VWFLGSFCLLWFYWITLSAIADKNSIYRVFVHMSTGLDQMVLLLACQRLGVVATATAVSTAKEVIQFIF
jgi:hypothetical protein